MINESGELVTPQNPVEMETPVIPAVETPIVAETPAPVIADASDLAEKNKQLFERAKRAETEAKELKERLKEIETQQVPSDSFAPLYGDEATQEVAALKKRLDDIQEKQELDALYVKFPAIKDKLDEFDEFKKEYPRHKLENVAKLFLVENGLLETPPVHTGLEKQTGGVRTIPASSKMTADDAKRLRETNYEAYRKAIKEGRIDLG